MRGWDVWLTTIGVITTVIATTVATWLASSNQYTVTGVTIGATFLVVSVFLVIIITGEFAPLSLIAILTYCQFTFFVARPLYVIFYQDSANIFSRQINDEFFVHAQTYAGIGFMVITLGYSLSLLRSTASVGRRRLIEMAPEIWLRLRPLLIVITAVGFLLYLAYILQSGWGTYWSTVFSGRSEENRSALQSSSAYLYAGLRFASGALIVIFAQMLVTYNRAGTRWAALLLVATTLPSVISGNRSDFIPIGVALIMVISMARPHLLKFRNVIVGLPILLFLGLIAPRIWRNNLAQGISINESLEQAATNDIFGGFLGGLDTAMVDALTLQVAAQESGHLPEAGGSTYLAAILSFVPRALWPGKPESVDEVLNAAIFPATDAKGIGFSFSIYSEPYFNFGLAGVVAVCLLFGIFLGVVTRKFRDSDGMFQAYIYVMVAAHLFPLMRGSLTFSSQRLLIPLVPVLIAMLIAYAASRRKPALADPGLGRPLVDFRSSRFPAREID